MIIQQRKRDREQRRRVKKDREERQRQRNVFCVINVKYKEISWRVKEEQKENSNFKKHRDNSCLKNLDPDTYYIVKQPREVGSEQNLTSFVLPYFKIFKNIIKYMAKKKYIDRKKPLFNHRPIFRLILGIYHISL